MATGFGQIPGEVIDYVRSVFADANDVVSTALTLQPSLHEPGLDMSFVGKLNACPPAFFAASQAAVAIETHWLGGRGMYGRWEIADIALFILLSVRGKLLSRKVVLLQTKRLYSTEIAGVELDESDYMIGIGRLVDRTDRRYPLSSQRTFRFDESSVYGALKAGSEQITRIEKYFDLRSIPVYYGLYNPLIIPHQGLYPSVVPAPLPSRNEIGVRVLPATVVHSVTSAFPDGRSPSFGELNCTALDADDANSTHGWRIERFVADEVLRCRQGALFDDTADTRLSGLLYDRPAPITSAIVISIDIGRPD